MRASCSTGQTRDVAHGLGLLAELSGGGQQRAAALQEPLAVARQTDAPARALEESHAELHLEVAHLSRQRGLGGPSRVAAREKAPASATATK